MNTNSIKLSKRLPEDLSPTPFFTELEHLKQSKDYIDLTISSPIKVGLTIDLEHAVNCAHKNFANYAPNAMGANFARKAVESYYKERGGAFCAGQIMLAASTSELYSVLFKVFCNPGDVILTPMPGYPLLETLASLEHLQCAPYFFKLSHKKGQEFKFTLDTDSFLTAPENAKILLLVSPHNPTGHCVSRIDFLEAVDFCTRNNLVLIIDEVFGDYNFTNEVERSWKFLNANSNILKDDFFEAHENDLVYLPKNAPKCPIIWLNGLSKTLGSPQIKLGWAALYAPRNIFNKIRAALEFVEDAYLSASSTAQALAVPMLLNSLDYEKMVLKRLLCNWNILRKTFSSKYCPQVQGGWYAALHLCSDDEELTLNLLKEKNILVQPGFFFDFDSDGWIVVSLLQESKIFEKAINEIANFCNTH